MVKNGFLSSEGPEEAKAAYDLVMTKVIVQDAEELLSIAQHLCDGVD